METLFKPLTRQRWVPIMFALITLSAFGPYLVGGLRTDQPFTYLVFLITVVLLPWRWMGVVTPAPIFPILLVWSIYASVACIGGIRWGGWPLPFDRGALLAGVDNVLLPVATMSIAAMWVRPVHRTTLLRLVCSLTSILAATNGVLALLMTRSDLEPIFRPFWAPAEENPYAQVTAILALEQGRVSGIINQPAEAGLLYGVAGLAAIYVWSERPWILYPILTPIIVGGILSVSKTFLLGALPIVLWQLWRAKRSRWTGALISIATFVAVVNSGALAKWTGFEFFARLLRPSGDGTVGLYSAGRFGTESTLSPVISAIFHQTPWIGVGASGVRVAYDNGWVEAFVNAGLVGAICYTLVLILILRMSLRLPPSERRLAVGLAIVGITASLGLPALTANRSGLLYWLIVGILATSQQASSGSSTLRPRATVTEHQAVELPADRRLADDREPGHVQLA